MTCPTCPIKEREKLISLYDFLISGTKAKISPSSQEAGRRMKHIVKIITFLVAISSFWIGLLQTSILPCSYTWLLPIYFIVSLGCYGLLMVGVGLMRFPTCPQEAILLQQDIVEAREFLKQRGVDVGGSD
ncbi:Dolichol-phosphate mannosyltransferase subunit [Trema orientale]|uniref:Dolichol-phosphate mannosyltransferase subunit 3 n=1 Tax=Trema orientale TaxID=63057 RepID=A0A2P5E7G1_TREOI|nr:Dolichol-phosphate mannosyltransferase subunit [Trema orientale]